MNTSTSTSGTSTLTYSVEVFTGFSWHVESEHSSRVDAFRRRAYLIADPNMRACDVRIVSLP